jgi:hypothetical protein
MHMHLKATKAIVLFAALLVVTACSFSLANKQANESRVPSAYDQTAEPEDTRPLVQLSEQNKYKYPDSPPNADPPTTWVEYINEQNGISVSFPFNPNWGTSEYRIPPYEISSNGWVQFGPLFNMEGGGVDRVYSFYKLPQKQTAAQIAQHLEEQYSDSNPPVKSVIKKIDHIDIVLFSSGEFCDSLDLYIVGKRDNYQISSRCDFGFGRGTSTQKYYEDIVRSIKFLE